jgi:YD repeat-containing protein
VYSCASVIRIFVYHNAILSLVRGDGRATTLTYNDFELSTVVDDSRGVLMEEAFPSF